MQVQDIILFAKKNNFSLTKHESIIIYNFIKRNYISILDGDEDKILELKYQLRKDLYQEIEKLYQKYKSKLSS